MLNSSFFFDKILIYSLFFYIYLNFFFLFLRININIPQQLSQDMIPFLNQIKSILTILRPNILPLTTSPSSNSQIHNLHPFSSISSVPPSSDLSRHPTLPLTESQSLFSISTFSHLQSAISVPSTAPRESRKTTNLRSDEDESSVVSGFQRTLLA